LVDFCGELREVGKGQSNQVKPQASISPEGKTDELEARKQPLKPSRRGREGNLKVQEN